MRVVLTCLHHANDLDLGKDNDEFVMFPKRCLYFFYTVTEVVRSNISSV